MRVRPSKQSVVSIPGILSSSCLVAQFWDRSVSFLRRERSKKAPAQALLRAVWQYLALG